MQSVRSSVIIHSLGAEFAHYRGPNRQDGKSEFITLYRLQAFTDGDPRHTGTVGSSELHEILNEHAFRMTSDQFNHIWNQLDKNADGKVDYRDFLKRFSTRTDVIRAMSTTPPLWIRDIRVRRQTLSPAFLHRQSTRHLGSPYEISRKLLNNPFKVGFALSVVNRSL